MTTPDSELLREFAHNRSEKVFATLVSRHVDLVYSAALRQVRSPQLAEEVAQTVFIDLSRNADKLARDTILTAWLYRVTRRAAIDVVRSESRRQLREQIAVELAAMNSPDTHWKEIEPLLDEAMETLDEQDRSSILLRYFENKSLREVGERLGTSDDAAQKRVSRAVERLREFCSKRNVTIGASELVVAISGNAVQAAPIGFAIAISSALTGTTLASAATETAIKTVAMTTLQKSLITAAIVAAVGAGIYETREASNLREQVESLKQQQQNAPPDQLQQLTSEHDNALRQFADLREENDRLNRNSAELIRLRGEVGMLKQRTTTLSNQLLRTSNRYGLLPEQMPAVWMSGVPDTAKAYARLVKKMAEGQITPAEEFNLVKGWPYLESRFSEPDEFGFFQSEYLTAMLGIKDKNITWELRRILENARDEEHAQGLRWARMSDERIQKSQMNINISQIRQQWAELNKKTTEQIEELLSNPQQQTSLSNVGKILDFDPRLKSTSEAVDNPKFKNLKPDEVFESFLPTQSGVRYVPAAPVQ